MGQTVVVVDDNPGFRSLIGQLLNATGFDVIGDAADGAEALAVTRRLHPDIVLLDVQMPGRDGFSVARQLVRESTSLAVVLTSGRSVVPDTRSPVVRASRASCPRKSYPVLAYGI